MSEIHGAVGSYVIDALDPDELEEFEAHLAVCPTCSHEVIEFCETAAELSLLASSVTIPAPPPNLRGSVLSAIAGTRVLPPEIPPRVAPMAPTPSVSPTNSVVTTDAVDELARRRQLRRTRVLTGLVAAAMVIALALGGWVTSLVRQQQTQVADQALETQLFSAPDAKVVTTTMKNGGKISFVVSKSLNRALFVGDDLPNPGDDQTYQLWTLNEAGSPTPDNLVTAGGDQRKFLNGSVVDAANLAVSLEPTGGSPTGTPTFLEGSAQI